MCGRCRARFRYTCRIPIFIYGNFIHVELRLRSTCCNCNCLPRLAAPATCQLLHHRHDVVQHPGALPMRFRHTALRGLSSILPPPRTPPHTPQANIIKILRPITTLIIVVCTLPIYRIKPYDKYDSVSEYLYPVLQCILVVSPQTSPYMRTPSTRRTPKPDRAIRTRK